MAHLEEQWELPAGFEPDGTMLSLSDVLAPDAEVLSRESLSREQRVELARARLQAGEWETLLICEEEVDRERAIRELEKGSELGDTVLGISERALALVMEDALRERRREQ